MGKLDPFARHCNRPYVDLLGRVGLDFDVVCAEGAIVEDQHGRKFVDCIAGYGNLNLGHNHPAVIEAVQKVLHARRPFGWPFISEEHARLVERLAEVAPGDLDCTFVVNSGAEAVDSALKLARLATGKPGVIACRGAWHGFTLGAMSVSEPGMCRGFEPLLPQVRQVAFGDSAAVRAEMSPEVGAVIVEPLQAESGAVVPPTGYLVELAEICRKARVVLIVDEIKTGMGKTGKLFACDHEHAVPDVLLVGKSLGGGIMPIGAMVARRNLWTKFGLSFPMSSSSAAGNAMACAAALATLQVIDEEKLCARVEQRGRRLKDGLQEIASRHRKWVRGLSGLGLLLSLHLASRQVALEVLRHCLQAGVMLMTAFLDRSRILIEPPLCISDSEIDQVVAALDESLARLDRRSHSA